VPRSTSPLLKGRGSQGALADGQHGVPSLLEVDLRQPVRHVLGTTNELGAGAGTGTGTGTLALADFIYISWHSAGADVQGACFGIYVRVRNVQ
jgi:hypothetical protein